MARVMLPRRSLGSRRVRMLARLWRARAACSAGRLRPQPAGGRRSPLQRVADGGQAGGEEGGLVVVAAFQLSKRVSMARVMSPRRSLESRRVRMLARLCRASAACSAVRTS